jgi:hypothetical protein
VPHTGLTGHWSPDIVIFRTGGYCRKTRRDKCVKTISRWDAFLDRSGVYVLEWYNHDVLEVDPAEAS